MSAAPTISKPIRLSAAVIGCGLGACVLWAYFPTLASLAQRWSSEPQYSHGYLVPVFALVVLWQRWRLAPPTGARASVWGLALLAAAGLVRLIAALLSIESVDGISFLICLLGLAVLFGGLPALRLCWPAVLYLAFMLPLPYRVDSALSQPLQWLAVQLSTYTLQTLGLPALSEGNIIVIGDLKLFVLEACNGLGMLIAFFALAGAMALLLQRPLWERIVLFLSAAPIGVLVNLIRITVTSLLFCWLGEGSETAKALSHDAAGWVMMPLALLLLWLEWKLLSRLFIKPEATGPVPVPRSREAAAAAAGARPARKSGTRNWAAAPLPPLERSIPGGP
jgi:exosortase